MQFKKKKILFTGHMDLTDLNYATKPYATIQAYEQSKLANVLFSRKLSQIVDKDEITVYSLHPGVVRTELGRHMENRMGPFRHLFWGLIWPFTKSPMQGAQTTIYCAIDEEISGHSGRYYSDCKEKTVASQGEDDETAEKLWEISAKLVNL